MKWNMKAPNVKKINLKHQTTSVDLKVTFFEKFIRFAPYALAAPYLSIHIYLSLCALWHCSMCVWFCIFFFFLVFARSDSSVLALHEQFSLGRVRATRKTKQNKKLNESKNCNNAPYVLAVSS